MQTTRRSGVLAAALVAATAAAGCGKTLAKLAEGKGPIAVEARAVVTALAKSKVQPKQVKLWDNPFQTSNCGADEPCAGIVVRGEGDQAHVIALVARRAGDIDLAPLSKLKALQRLRLSFNGITEVRGLVDLPNLRRVDLASNAIRRVEGLRGLPRLTELDLRKNQLTELRGLKDLPSLSTLRLGGNPLHTVKDLDNLGISALALEKATGLATLSGLTRLPNLRRIVVPKGTLQSLELADLPRLAALDVRFNQLTRLSLRNLPKLETVGAMGNKLTSSGLVLEKLPSLTHLGLDRNQLTAVPVIQGRTRSKWLSLQHNRLTSLAGLEKLKPTPQELFVDHNQLTDLKVGPRAVTLSRVMTLAASSNQLTSLAGIDKFRFVRYLYLSRNRLTSLAGIDKLLVLRKVRVAHNKLTSLKPLRVAGLKELVANGNRIASAPELFGPENNRRPRIDHYDLRGNAFATTTAVVLYYGRPPLYRGLRMRPVVWSGVTYTRRYGGSYGRRYGRSYGYRRVGSRYYRGGSYRYGK